MSPFVLESFLAPVRGSLLTIRVFNSIFSYFVLERLSLGNSFILIFSFLPSELNPKLLPLLGMAPFFFLLLERNESVCH